MRHFSTVSLLRTDKGVSSADLQRFLIIVAPLFGICCAMYDPEVHHDSQQSPIWLSLWLVNVVPATRVSLKI